MLKFYGIEYKPLTYSNYYYGTNTFDKHIDTNEDFHNMLYTAFKMFIDHKNIKLAFISPCDYTHLGLKKNGHNYELNSIMDIIPLIDKSAVRAMIDSEMLKLSRYADLARLNSTKSARNV